MERHESKANISIIIPVYNEEKAVSILIDQIVRVLSPRTDFEIIIVDDGSSDSTLGVVKGLSLKHDNVVYISFSRNFGHQNALRAGLDFSKGEAIISMDGDLQHPPELLPQMIEKWEQGFDVVTTTRRNTAENSRFKRWSSFLYYRLINKIGDVELQQGAADFRLLDRKVVTSLKLFEEKSIFYRGLVAWVGFKQCQIGYDPNSRVFGSSKYSLRRMTRLAVDGLTSFSVMPLRLATLSGILISLLSFLYAIYALLIKIFTENAAPGWSSIMAGIYFLGGIQLIFLGLHGEYIGKIFMEVKRRPNYIVSETNLKASVELGQD